MRFLLLLCLLPALCLADTQLYLMRHGEKALDDPKDPSLSPAGRQRAQALAAWLADKGISAVYCSQYRRTCDTALPAAQGAGLVPQVVPIAGDIHAFSRAFAQRLLKEHQGQAVLVVGHSNTIPALVTALSGQPMAALAEGDYGRLFALRVDERGVAELEMLKVGN